jgi:DNA-binding NarL/FixJ family response regulator
LDHLAASLHDHFSSVAVAHSLEELRDAIPRHRAHAVIVDLEMTGLGTIEDLRRQFPNTNIVCTHRVADEEMWASALDAGANDMCCSSDVENVVRATLRSLDALTAWRAA